jgi:hypothetical protein
LESSPADSFVQFAPLDSFSTETLVIAIRVPSALIRCNKPQMLTQEKITALSLMKTHFMDNVLLKTRA